ncbi:Protein kinase family protein [Rhynchospora pubera]|uniref:non-specific serine/threonine protein kinase n=1 Tax=Rhynchospora pubera TaxID=906938 RepID=A0AAV8FRG3_9POAL|nr:Protein kinase family protein [Rhynchospora pubera]
MRSRLFPVICLLFHLWSVALSDAIEKNKCAPVKCGNVDISYPFWIPDQQADYCGYPTLEINCHDDKPFLVQSYDANYYIDRVFYDNSSFVLINSILVDYKFNCTVPQFNVSLGLGPMVVSKINKELVFFFNCGNMSSPPGEYQPTPCVSGQSDGAGNQSFVRLFENYNDGVNTSVPGESLGNCSISRIPVSGWNVSEVGQYTTLMNDGFLVELKVTSCSDCQKSGGECGFNTSSVMFMCICSDDHTYPMSCPNSKVKKEDTKKTILIVCISVGVGGFLVACCACLLLCKRKKLKWVSSSSLLLTPRDSSDQYFHDLEMAGSQSTQIFSYEELEEATDRFSPSKELGDGGFGTVYRGKLRDGRIVAVKRLYQNSYKRAEQFMNEVDILSRLHHHNLVSLYGCTARTSRELLLVYEYVSNGTVADHLHGPRSCENALSWPVRLSIAIETADALAYLHAVEPQIIHRDVKTNNILLDDGFHVKVGDFGLSRLFPLDVSHVSTVPQGTPGYVDPVYHQCYQLTDRSDVYSFGVVLVELISSKPAVDMNRSRDEINLANMALNKIQRSELDDLVDPNLGFQSNWEMRRMVSLVAELAFRCLQSDRDMRPSIKEVLEALKVIEKGGQSEDKFGKENSAKEEAHLLKSDAIFSPVTVMERWKSSSTTPNTSI